MRTILAGVVVIAAYASPAHSSEDAQKLLARWADAFAKSDVDAIVDTYASDALFVGTGSKTVVTDTAGIRQYFQDALMRDRPRGATFLSSSTLPLADGSVIVTGLDSVTGVRDGQQYSAAGRVTFVVAKRGADWKIVHFHRSAMPR